LITGKSARSRADIITLLGESAGTFDNNGIGMTRIRANFNAAFKPLEYKSTPAIHIKNNSEFIALVSKGEKMVVETRTILGEHIVIIEPMAPDYTRVNVYNYGPTTPTGHAKVMDMSAEDAARLPIQKSGESNSIWILRPIPKP
jgi:hypothetical protein